VSDPQLSCAGARCCTRPAKPRSSGAHAYDPVLIQAFIANSAIDTLHVGVVHGFARANEGQARDHLVGPSIECLAFEIASMVLRDRGSLSAQMGKPIERRSTRILGCDVSTFDRRILTREVIDEVERARLPAMDQAARHVVHRPVRIRRLRRGQRESLCESDALGLSRAHDKALFPK